MKKSQIIFKMECLDKFYPIQSHPITQTIEFYLRKKWNIEVSIDVTLNGYYFYFLDYHYFVEFLKKCKIYLEFMKNNGSSIIRDKEDLTKNWIIYLVSNDTNKDEKELLDNIIEMIVDSSYHSFKLRKLKEPLEKNKNIGYIIEMKTIKRKFLIKSVKEFYNAIKHTILGKGSE